MGRPKKIEGDESEVTEEVITEVETPSSPSKVSSDRQEAIDREAGVYKKK